MRKLSMAGAALAGIAALWLSANGCGGGGSTTTSGGGTGAFGVVTISGKQLLYYPNKGPLTNGHGYVSVIDVGQKGSGLTGVPALVTTIDLGTTDMATTTAGTSSIVVAAGTDTYDVWFINPSSNTLTKTLTLSTALLGNTFSGGGGIVNGIAIDSAKNRAILAVWNGFLFVDLGSMTVSGSIVSAPSENFGFDATHELLVNPFYACGNTHVPSGGSGGNEDAGFCAEFQAGDAGQMNSGVNVINLATSKVYTYENLEAPDPTNPLGTSEPDSAAVDPALQIAALPPEGVSAENFLDLSKASYDDAALTFTAPLITVQMNEYDGVAVEPTSHLAFFEEEFEDGVALIDMTKLTDGDAGLPASALVQAQMPGPPPAGGEGWSNLGDPHGIAVTTGLSSSGPVGFVVNDDDFNIGSGSLWIARIDLAKMLTLAGDGGPLSATEFGEAVTMLNGSAKE